MERKGVELVKLEKMIFNLTDLASIIHERKIYTN